MSIRWGCGVSRVTTTALVTILAGFAVIAPPATSQTIFDRLVAKALHPRDDRARHENATTSKTLGALAAPATAAGADFPPADFSAPAEAQAAVAPLAARPSPPPPGGGPLSLDVAGIRLGMPYGQLRGTLAASYRCKMITMTKTFAQRVTVEVGRRRGKGVYQDDHGLGYLQCEGPSGENLTIGLAHGPTGPVVDNIRLDVSHDRVDGASVLRQVRGKFGPPSNGTPSNGCWTTAVSDCVAIPPIGPRMRAFDTIDRVVIMGDRGERAVRADEAAVQAAADRIAPRRSGAAL